MIYLSLEPDALAGLRRQFDINEAILRFLFLKIEPRIVDALVAHARSAPVPAVAPAEETAVAVAVVDEIPDVSVLDEALNADESV